MKVRVGFCLVLLGLVHGGLAQDILDYGVSEDDQQTIIDIHNNYRLSIANGLVSGQPRGINLLRMKYDDTLAEAAQEVANTTIFAHATVTDDRWAVGQNLYLLSSTDAGGSANWTSAIAYWFKENTSYNYRLCCDSSTGHYTQIVWADTEYIGCGYTYFLNSTLSYPYRKLYVCNYGPAGNWVGEYPYETGDSGCEDLC